MRNFDLRRGKRLFAEGAVPRAYALTRSHVSRNGLVVAHYERAGTVQTADVLGAPSERELRRRERMTREG